MDQWNNYDLIIAKELIKIYYIYSEKYELEKELKKQIQDEKKYIMNYINKFYLKEIKALHNLDLLLEIQYENNYTRKDELKNILIYKPKHTNLCNDELGYIWENMNEFKNVHEEYAKLCQCYKKNQIQKLINVLNDTKRF